MYKILWLITARSGSKSLPNKNIRNLGEHPLLAYRIITTLESLYNEHIWLSTDSEEYALIAKKYGAKVPFIRPSHLASDEAQSVDVVLNAMNFAEENGMNFEFIGLLEPTSPFISADILNDALELLESNNEADAVVAVKEHRPNTIFVQDNDTYLDVLSENLKKISAIGRQNFKKQITPSGGFYISKWNSFKKNKSFYTRLTLPFLVDEINALEIDEPMDWQLAEFIIERGLFNFNNQRNSL